MRQPVEVIETDSPKVACDGGGGALGHPNVYLTIKTGGAAENPHVDCPYCGRRFVLTGSAKSGH